MSRRRSLKVKLRTGRSHHFLDHYLDYFESEYAKILSEITEFDASIDREGADDYQRLVDVSREIHAKKEIARSKLEQMRTSDDYRRDQVRQEFAEILDEIKSLIRLENEKPIKNSHEKSTETVLRKDDSQDAA